MPITACIALGSFINTRIVIHLKKPTMILSIGFTLLLSSAGLSFVRTATPHLWVAIAMGATGIGLGFILNNVNIFGQEIAGRERFGITTALLQSTRMVGGMLGTSIVGTIVARTISVLGAPVSAQWLPRFDDPRILVDEALRDTLLGDLGHAGLDASALFDAARDALVQSIHIGTMLTAVAALVAALLARRIAHITFRKVGTSAVKPEGPPAH